MNRYALVVAVSLMGQSLSANAAELDIQRGFDALPNACEDTSSDTGAKACIEVIAPLAMDIYEHWNNIDLTARASETMRDFDEKAMTEKALRLTHLGSLKAKCGPLYPKNPQDFNFSNTQEAVDTLGKPARDCFATIADGMRQFPEIKTSLPQTGITEAYNYANCLVGRVDTCDVDATTLPEKQTKQKEDRPDYSESMGGDIKTNMQTLATECFGDLTERKDQIECLIADTQATLSLSDGVTSFLNRSLQFVDSPNARSEISLGLKNIDRECTQPLTTSISGKFEDILKPTLMKIDNCVQTQHFTLYGGLLGFNQVVNENPKRYDNNDIFIQGLRGISDASLTLMEAQQTPDPQSVNKPSLDIQ